MHKLNKLLVLLLLGTAVQSKAQTAFSASSHSATIEGNTYEYVIGEMTVVSTDRNSNLIVTQGFLQPLDGSKPSGMDNANLSNAIKIYPNPTEDIVNIESLEEIEGKIVYQLFDATGKVLLSNQMDNLSRFTVDLKSFAAGNYYLLLSVQGVAEPQKYSYKIQKK